MVSLRSSWSRSANALLLLVALLLVALLVVAPPLLATEAPSGALQTALDAYWSRHPQAQALSARADAADAAHDQANGFLAGAPTLSLSRLDQRDGESRETELEFALPLAGNRHARQQQTRAERAAIAAETATLRLTLAAELLRIDAERRYRDEALLVSQQRLQLMQTLAHDVQQKVSAGELARADALLANAEALTAEATLLAAEQAADEARDQWQLRVGPLPGFADATDALVAPAPHEPFEHPQLQHALALAQAATAKAQFEQRRSGDTELSLLMKREEDPLLDEVIDSAGLRISLPLFAGANRQQSMASAQAERLSAEAEAQRLRLALTQEQLQARQLWQRANQQQQLAEQQLQLTEQSWRLAQAAFAAGEIALSELLRQQQRLFDSREWRAQLKQQHRDALARLVLAEGALP